MGQSSAWKLRCFLGLDVSGLESEHIFFEKQGSSIH